MDLTEARQADSYQAGTQPLTNATIVYCTLPWGPEGGALLPKLKLDYAKLQCNQEFLASPIALQRDDDNCQPLVTYSSVQFTKKICCIDVLNKRRKGSYLEARGFLTVQQSSSLTKWSVINVSLFWGLRDLLWRSLSHASEQS